MTLDDLNDSKNWPAGANWHVLDIDGHGFFMGGDQPFANTILGVWCWETPDLVTARVPSGIRDPNIGQNWKTALMARPDVSK